MSTRRDFIAGAAAGIALSPALGRAKTDAKPGTQLAPGEHKVVDLPFAPGKLKGLSAAMLTSHHDNNYAGAIKNLNKVELDLAKVTKDTPGYLVAALRE